MRLGRVTSTSPLLVCLNGDTTSAPARAVGSFAGVALAAEVLVETVERHRYAWRVFAGPAPIVPPSGSGVGTWSFTGEGAGEAVTPAAPVPPPSLLPAAMPFAPGA